MKKTRRASVPVSKKPTGAKASKKTRARNASVSVGKKQSGRRAGVSSAGGRSKSVENKMKRSNKTSSKTSHKMSKKTAPKKKFRCTFCDLWTANLNSHMPYCKGGLDCLHCAHTAPHGRWMVTNKTDHARYFCIARACKVVNGEQQEDAAAALPDAAEALPVTPKWTYAQFPFMATLLVAAAVTIFAVFTFGNKESGQKPGHQGGTTEALTNGTSYLEWNNETSSLSANCTGSAPDPNNTWNSTSYCTPGLQHVELDIKSAPLFNTSLLNESAVVSEQPELGRGVSSESGAKANDEKSALQDGLSVTHAPVSRGYFAAVTDYFSAAWKRQQASWNRPRVNGQIKAALIEKKKALGKQQTHGSDAASSPNEPSAPKMEQSDPARNSESALTTGQHMLNKDEIVDAGKPENDKDQQGWTAWMGWS
ncbi:unnamed protein product [Amoebophrya sp. A120]|nr:unnamed protein product [Amoebophrya sp. A120]|eukprot:GSA120T00024269001.1